MIETKYSGGFLENMQRPTEYKILESHGRSVEGQEGG